MATQKTPRAYESLQDSARRIGVTVKTLRRWIAQGKLTAYRPSKRVIRLDAAEVDAMMDATATTRWNEVA